MYVIAGASGRTGSKVAEALLAERAPVRVLVRSEAQVQAWRARGAEARVLALEDVDALRDALVGAHAFFALVPDRTPNRSAIVDALVAAARTHVVLLSAAADVGPCALLREAERRLREVTSLCALRPCMFQESVPLQEGVYANFFGAHRVPLIATRDVAMHAVRCLRTPRSEIVDLVGPIYSGAEIAAALQARLVESVPAVFPELFARLPHVTPHGDRLVAGATSLEQTWAGRL